MTHIYWGNNIKNFPSNWIFIKNMYKNICKNNKQNWIPQLNFRAFLSACLSKILFVYLCVDRNDLLARPKINQKNFWFFTKMERLVLALGFVSNPIRAQMGIENINLQNSSELDFFSKGCISLDWVHNSVMITHIILYDKYFRVYLIISSIKICSVPFKHPWWAPEKWVEISRWLRLNVRLFGFLWWN